MKEHFDWAVKVGSFSSKIFAIGIATVGIARLWSQSAREKHSLTARVAYSSAYLLHVGTTSLAAASFLGTSPVTPQVATALMGATSLLTNYVSALDTQVSHSMLEKEYEEREGRLNHKQQNLSQKIALLETAKDYEAQIQILEEEQKHLKTGLDDLTKARTLPKAQRKQKFIDIFSALDEIFQAKARRNHIISAFFLKQPQQVDIEIVFQNISDQINAATLKLSKKKSSILEAEIERLGILNVQCIRYKKIETTIREFKTHLTNLGDDQSLHAKTIKPILEARIKILEANLKNLVNPTTDLQWLELPLTMTLSQWIENDIQGFDQSLSTSLTALNISLQKQITVMKQNAEKVEFCLNLLFNNPARELQKHFSSLRNENQALAKLKKNLTLEKFKKQASATSVNFSTITTLLAVSLCLVPEQNTNYLIKILMLSFGFVGSTTSFLNFCKKYMLEINQEKQVERNIKRQEMVLEFGINSRLQGPIPKVIGKRTSQPRQSKTKANQVMTVMFEQGRTRRAHKANHETPNKRKVAGLK